MTKFNGTYLIYGPRLPKRNRTAGWDRVLFNEFEFYVTCEGNVLAVQKDKYDIRLEFANKCDLGTYLIGISLTGYNFLQYARKTRDAVFGGDGSMTPRFVVGMAELSHDKVEFSSRYLGAPGIAENGTIDISFRKLYDWTKKNLNVSCSLFYQNDQFLIYKAVTDGWIRYYLVDKTPNPALCAYSVIGLVHEYRSCRLDWYPDASNFLISRSQTLASNFQYIRRDIWTKGVKNHSIFKTFQSGGLQCSIEPFTDYPDCDDRAKAFVNYVYDVPMYTDDFNLIESPFRAKDYTVAHYLLHDDTTLSSDDHAKINHWNRITGTGCANCAKAIKYSAMKIHEIYESVYHSLLDFIGYKPYQFLP